MKGFVPPDPETSVSAEHHAVVYAPKRARRRNRFPVTNVSVVESEQAAMEQADENAERYAARVLGPSKSSEGVFIYYLVEWL